MRMFKLYIASVLVFVLSVLSTANAYARNGQNEYLEEGFKLLTRAEEYYKAVIHIDLKTQYKLMSPNYQASVTFGKFKKTFGEALPYPNKPKSNPMHISGRSTSKSTSMPLGLMKLLKRKKNINNSGLPPPSVTNKLLYSFKKVKFLKKEKAIVYFDVTEYYRMPIMVPGRSPYIERTKSRSDSWVKVDEKWYRGFEVRSINLSGNKFNLPIKKGKKELGGVVRKLDNIIKYKLGTLAKYRFSANNTHEILTKLLLLAPLRVHAYIEKRGIASLEKTMQKGLNSRIEQLNFSLKRVPSSPNIMRKIAEVSKVLGNTSDALDAYLKSTIFEKNNLKTIVKISDLYFEKEEYKKSLKYMDKYLTLNIKVRASHIKPKMQRWLESRTAVKEKAKKLINSIGRQGTENLFVELVRKQAWYTAAELAKKLYEYEGFRVQNKIEAALKKRGGKPNIISMKVSDFVPRSMNGILQRISVFELSRMLRFFEYNIYRTGSPIGTTGVNSPVNIMVRSAGYFLYNNRIYGKYDNIIIGRKDVSPHRIGYNVVVIDEVSGKVLQKKNFDTAFGKGNSDVLADFIDKIRDGRIVVLSSREEASEHLTKKAVDAMRSIGAKMSLIGKFRWAHAVIGVKGAKPGTAQEMLSLYPANITVYKSNSPYNFKELMEDSSGKILKKIKRNTVFISDIQPSSTLLLAFP